MQKIFLISGFIFYSIYTLNAQNPCPTNFDLNWMQANEPDRYQRFLELENFTVDYSNSQNSPTARLITSNGVIIIPVVVHVLHKGEQEGIGLNISMAQIQSQIDVLNEDFRRLNADRIKTPNDFSSRAADYGIEFRLACIDPNGNPTNGVVRKLTNKNLILYSAFQNGITNDESMGIKISSAGGDDAWADK